MNDTARPTQTFAAVMPSLIVLLLSVMGPAKAQELIQDRGFQQGFYLWKSDSTFPFLGPIRCDDDLPAAVWDIAQWTSKSSLLNITPFTTPSGMCKWADVYKDFRFGGAPGAEEYQLYFSVNSQNEYGNVNRKAGQPWVHLLVEQRLSPPYDFPGQGPGSPPISILDSLVFKIDAKLLDNLTVKNAGYDANLHAAQFQVFFTIQNLNKASPGYGKYIWLGVPIYDDRAPMLPGSVAFDLGTQTLINSIPSADVTKVSLHDGGWVHIQVNLFPYATAALDTAWAHGYLQGSKDKVDYKIGEMNMGWELPGMNIATVAVKGISLFAFTATAKTRRVEAKNVRLITAYPNPATAAATIQFYLPASGNLKVGVYDEHGREVKTLAHGYRQAGMQNFTWDAQYLPWGAYHYRFQSGEQVTTSSLIIR